MLFGLLLALWIVVGIASMTAGSRDGHGTQHVQFETMDQGGSGQQRHGHILVLGWSFGVLQIATFVGCLALGARRKERLGRLKWAFVVGGLLYAAEFSAIFVSYHRFLQQADPSFLGPFPAPTTWLLVGLWAAPLYFVLLYVITFDRNILTADDFEKFQQLLAARRQQQENGR